MKVKRALISVFNKAGLEEFARALADIGVEIISTGGTARMLGDKGIPVTEVSEVTGSPRCSTAASRRCTRPSHGRHPRQARRARAHGDHRRARHRAHRHGRGAASTRSRRWRPARHPRGAGRIENIDIGGPSMIRAAAKNHAGVAVVTEPDDYAAVLDELKAERRRARRSHVPAPGHQGVPPDGSLRLRHRQLVLRDRGRLSQYIMRDYEKVMELSYGENPHQRAAYYSESGAAPAPA